MKKVKAVLTFLRYSVIKKIGTYRYVIEKLTNNVTFPTPDVPLADATAVTNKLEEAYYASRDGSHEAISLMHQRETEADEVFHKLVDYVNRIADGDESKILSSGFEVSKEPTPRQKAELTITEGEKPGTLVLRRQAVKGARSYVWQCCKGDSPISEDQWTNLGVSTQATYEAINLISGQRYWFRVAAVTTEGTGAYAPAVSKIAQ